MDDTLSSSFENLKSQGNIIEATTGADIKTEIEVYSLSILTDRNKALAATVYRPKSAVKKAIMMAPATGIKRQFYHNFATYLAEHGFGILTYDNEGIGDSLTTDLAKSDASLISWGRYDMPAVLDALQDEFADASYHLIGHSAGGQLIGLMPNYESIASVFNVACSSGRIKNMRMSYRLKAKFFMDIFIPLNNLILGYTASDKVGMGAPLPKNVARQWSEWCNGAGYIKTAFGKSIHTHFYNDIAMKALWLGFSDDDIANSKNMDDMIRVFSQMPVEKRFFDPKEFGLDSIGHMLYFSRRTNKKAPELWQMAVDWLKAA